MIEDTALLNAIKKFNESPNLTEEEYRKKMSFMNDEDCIDDLDFNAKKYDILEHIVFE